ncbi:MAG: hypothetical protein A2V88_06530 [Elusimicrobia bacterium RBG_16_66_12]|nr:MAG: hypothetical protein A2V88_06530 [Elusimicrobia bacterium RBG_16_66_12]
MRRYVVRRRGNAGHRGVKTRAKLALPRLILLGCDPSVLLFVEFARQFLLKTEQVGMGFLRRDSRARPLSRRVGNVVGVAGKRGKK